MSEGYQNLAIDGSARRADPHAMLLADLADFATCHRPCGQLTGDATEPAPDGYMLSVVCSCGVTFLRWVAMPHGRFKVSARIADGRARERQR
jgi:hypothetical protein